jgi:capsular exopolysaccharide synthesis family protein
MENSDDNIFDFREYWHIIQKRRWTIFTILIITVSIVALGSFFIEPKYKATVAIQIERQNPKVLSFEEVYALDSSQQTFYQTQVRLIKSKTLAKKVIDKLDLAKSSPSSSFNKIGIIQKLKELIPSFTNLSKNEKKEPYAPIINNFLSRLIVQPDRNSQIINISFIHHNPDISAKVANAVADAFIESNLEAKYLTAKQAYDFLNAQIKELMNDIALKEQEMQKYAQEKEIVSLDNNENITIQQLVDLNAEYTRIQAKRIEKEAIYKGVMNASSDSIPEVLNNELIQELKTQYAHLESEYAEKSRKFKAQWPEMMQLKSKLDKVKQRLGRETYDIVRKVRNSARTEYETALKQERSIKNILDQQKRKTTDLHKNAIIYNNLKTEVDNKRALLQSLVKRQNEAGVSAELKDLGSSHIRVIDRADVPRKAYKPNKKLNILMAIAIGLLIGIGTTFFLEYLDSSLKNKEDVDRYLKLPTIGIIPTLDGTKKSSNYTYVYEDYLGKGKYEVPPKSIEKIVHTSTKSSISEAYRSLRTSILLSTPHSPPKTILITSSQPKEGKTVTAVNIAISLAQLNKKVVIFDTDLRKPRISKIFRIYNRIGVSNFLAGTIPPNQIIFRTEIPNLYIIPSGPTPPNPAELLATPKMTSLLEGCKNTFNFIILDSPPLLAVTDAQILANKVDGIVLVIHGGITPKDAVKLGKEKLQNANIIGVVLNQIDLENHGYYYQHYYHYYSKEKDKKLVIKFRK